MSSKLNWSFVMCDEIFKVISFELYFQELVILFNAYIVNWIFLTVSWELKCDFLYYLVTNIFCFIIIVIRHFRLLVDYEL